LGNVGDASARLREALATADVIAAEDTRRVRDLARHLQITLEGRVVALHDHNERDKAQDLVRAAADGLTVVMVSDAGMPTISDPGFRVVQLAAQEGVTVTVLPGPSAVLTGLALSGLPTDRFCFEGFVPRKAGERATMLDSLAVEERTMVFFEAPHRLQPTLAAMATAWGGDRQAAVSRELTKLYEHTERGTLDALVAWAQRESPRGEMVLTVAGRPPQAASLESLVAEVQQRVATGERSKDVVADVATAAEVSSRVLYQAVLDAKGGS
jgi:16S rRNA (cytidine1402-2'-O)-methyltransferase